MTEPSEEGPGAVCTPGDDGNRGERNRGRQGVKTKPKEGTSASAPGDGGKAWAEGN